MQNLRKILHISQDFCFCEEILITDSGNYISVKYYRFHKHFCKPYSSKYENKICCSNKNVVKIKSGETLQNLSNFRNIVAIPEIDMNTFSWKPILGRDDYA